MPCFRSLTIVVLELHIPSLVSPGPASHVYGPDGRVPFWWGSRLLLLLLLLGFFFPNGTTTACVYVLTDHGSGARMGAGRLGGGGVVIVDVAVTGWGVVSGGEVRCWGGCYAAWCDVGLGWVGPGGWVSHRR